MAFGERDVAVTRTASVEERVVEITLRRMDGKAGAELDIIVTIERNGKRLQRRLTDDQVDTLWNGSSVRSFRNWIMNAVIPNAR